MVLFLYLLYNWKAFRIADIKKLNEKLGFCGSHLRTIEVFLSIVMHFTNT